MKEMRRPADGCQRAQPLFLLLNEGAKDMHIENVRNLQYYKSRY